jgi:FtsH-binding integral membrane protein
MSYALDYSQHRIAAEASADARAAFIRRTYGHLAGAILAFAALETALIKMVPEETIFSMFSGRFSWMICLLAFMAVAWLADYWARSGASPLMQYAGLGLYIVAEAVIFLPLLYVAAYFAAPDVIPKAGILTLTIFGGLTVAVLVTRQDFSFLRAILSVGSFVALGIIVVSLFMGGGLGLWFSAAMVVLACGFILYDTSNVLHHYRTDQHVAASLALFASVALLFWYILQIFLASSRRD